MDYYFPLLHKKMKDEIEFYHHISNRLGVPYCLMLLFSDQFVADSHAYIARNLRRIDIVKKIDENTIGILFFVADSKKQEAVINRVITFLHQNCHAKRFHIGIACNNEDSDDVLLRALQNMLEAKEENKEVVYDF